MHTFDARTLLNECIREEKQDGESDAIRVRWWKFDDVIANGIFGANHVEVSFRDGPTFVLEDALLLRECGTLVEVQTIPRHIRDQALLVTVQANDIAEDRVPLWLLDQAVLRVHANSKVLKNLMELHYSAQAMEEEQYFVNLEAMRKHHRDPREKNA